MASRVFRATAAMMGALEHVLKLSLHVEGVDNLVDRPTLFVVNHFTRMETFIVPYALYKHTDKELRALADSKLFKGIFGTYLQRMGAYSTKEPLRNRTIIGDLVSGQHDWVIFPEGVMVKSKQVMHGGRLRFIQEGRSMRPHTGAAVLALKATLVREHYLQALRKGDAAMVAELEGKYGLVPERCIDRPGPVITPVNITFYPLRPDENVISKIAVGLVKGISDSLVEELMTEGSLLLRKTDMILYFSPPIEVRDYLDRPLARLGNLPFLTASQRDNLILTTQRWPLTQRFMKTIYSTTAVNLDHLFCLGLQLMKSTSMRIEDFHRALYLSALAIRRHEGRWVHESLHNDLIKLVADEPHEPLESIYRLAHAKGVVERSGGCYRLLHRNEQMDADDKRVRLHGTTQVIANEVAPMEHVVGTVRKYINMRVEKARSEVASQMAQMDLQHFEEEYDKYRDEESSKSADVGRPFLLPGGDTGVLLCHGYLAAPQEMRPLGNFLHKAGYSVYGARLQGFGTSPVQLLEVTWKDWVLSFNRAYAVLKNRCTNVVLGGFSAGALLALLAAARKKAAIQGVFCIDTPLILMDRRACTLAPAAEGLNRLARKMRLPDIISDTIVNDSETPDINYSRHYLYSVGELCKLITECRNHLSEVEAPCLVIHGSHDPIADPEGAEMVLNSIGSKQKRQLTIDADYHNLVQCEGREKVFEEVLRFLREDLHQPMKEVA